MNLIVAVDQEWGIGRQGKLLFSLKGDMRFFKETTMGHTVVMGRGTLESLPGARPLKGRRNIVLSHQPAFEVEGAEVCHSFEELFQLLQEGEEVFVMGGASLYNGLLPYCEKAYITRVDASGGADVFITDISSVPGWEEVAASEPMCEGELSYRFCTWRNRAVRPWPAVAGGESSRSVDG